MLHLHTPPQHPALPGFRLALRQAMITAGDLPAWTETYSDNPNALLELIVDERIVLELSVNQPAPAPARLVGLLHRPAVPTWRQQASRAGQLSVRFLSALFIAFFPKCPFCWAAYMSYLGATGVVSVQYQPWLIWVLAGLLAINVGVLYWTRHRHGLGPFWLCLAGAALVITNRLWLNEPALLWLGAGCLLVGSLWNSLSQKMTDSIRYWGGVIGIAPHPNHHA